MARSLLGSKEIVAFVATAAPAKARKFYRDTLGLRPSPSTDAKPW